MYIDNKGNWLSKKTVQNYKMCLMRKTQILEFDDVDFRPTSNYVVDPYPSIEERKFKEENQKLYEENQKLKNKLNNAENMIRILIEYIAKNYCEDK